MGNVTYHYKQAIALLAQKIYDSGLLKDERQIDWVSPWDALTPKFPELNSLAEQVEETLNYELSYSQCCNAIKWAKIYDPAEWAHLISS